MGLNVISANAFPRLRRTLGKVTLGGFSPRPDFAELPVRPEVAARGWLFMGRREETQVGCHLKQRIHRKIAVITMGRRH